MTNISKKNLTVIIIVVVAVVGWFVAAQFFGPNSERGIAKEVERLQKDSVALQDNFAPRGQYTYLQDICKEVIEIMSLGQPLRYGNAEIDSVRLFGNIRTAAIANYNINKCDSVLSDVLPMWRSVAILAFGAELKRENPNTIVKTNTDFPNYTGVIVYSIRYTNKSKIEDDAYKYNPMLASLGFKSITYAMSPESPGIEYTYK